VPSNLRSATRRAALLTAVALLLTSLLAPLAASARPAGGLPPQAQADRQLTVMTRNLYLGAELGPIFAADSQQALLGAVTQTFQAALASDFPGRAQLLADEIVAADPELVGLQEVSLWRTGQFGEEATTVEQDFLAILLDALAERGVRYEPVSVVEAFDGQLPALGPQGLFEARLTDRDVILARADVPASRVKVLSSDAGIFDAALPLEVLGQPLPVIRGWTSVDVKVRGTVVRFVNSHFEAFDPGEVVRVAQARELLAGPLATSLPVVLVGDFNSNAGPGLAYNVLLGGGFVDAWSVTRPGDPGLTCCHAGDLLNETLEPFRSRIDLVLTRGVTAVATERVGVDPARRTPEGRWPSDHAGVVAELVLPRPGARR
jgi:endonuclease/exonuclease/phosphatase family metal-dependent hydrolase